MTPSMDDNVLSHKEKRLHRVLIQSMQSCCFICQHVIMHFCLYSHLVRQSNTPQQADGASNLQRSRAAGYLTLAAFAKYSCKHGTLLIVRGNEQRYNLINKNFTSSDVDKKIIKTIDFNVV